MIYIWDIFATIVELLPEQSLSKLLLHCLICVINQCPTLNYHSESVLFSASLVTYFIFLVKRHNICCSFLEQVVLV